ncbi:MAG TPA: glycosyltransferase family 4 protein [Thermoplasmata archaeon]|nr:glycosyltransferase family 4 protein [Thermoplasmata archaeon]
MKVVQLTLRFDAPGGVETTVREVASRLPSHAVSPTVFASDLFDESSWERRTSWRPTVAGIPVRRFPVFKRLLPGITMPLMGGLLDALRTERPDVIHAHSHRYGHVLQAAAVAKSSRIPLVVSTHYHPADRRESARKRALLRLQDVGFGMTAYRVARALVVETELERRLIGEFAPADRIRVIPPGIDLEAWHGTESSDPPPPGTPPSYLLYAGRLASNKGLTFLLEAFAQLREGDRPGLVLMGHDWGEREGLRARARALGIDAHVQFLDYVEDPAQVRSIFRHALAFVLPSEWEAYGLVLLNAMAAHCPIVATSVGGVPEAVGPNGAALLVPYGDPGALAAALERVSTDAALRQRLSAAGDRRVESLTWDRAVESHVALYRELVGES